MIKQRIPALLTSAVLAMTFIDRAFAGCDGADCRPTPTPTVPPTGVTVTQVGAMPQAEIVWVLMVVSLVALFSGVIWAYKR